MPNTDCSLTTDELVSLLREDAPHGDLTTRTLSIGQQPARIHLDARDSMIVCGIEEAERLFQLAGADEISRYASSGDPAEPGTPLLSASGTAQSLFMAWKVAQSLVESLSGVSSCMRELVDRADGTVVACTRKHMPGTKSLMVKAVLAGGGIMHRLGLSESIMVTAEHRLFLENDDSHAYLAEMRTKQPEKKCVVEVDSLVDAISLLGRGCDVVQLEKLPVQEIVRVVAIADADQTRTRPVIAAAGGINPSNVAEYAATGVDLLVTSSPYFASPRDVQVKFEIA